MRTPGGTANEHPVSASPMTACDSTAPHDSTAFRCQGHAVMKAGASQTGISGLDHWENCRGGGRSTGRSPTRDPGYAPAKTPRPPSRSRRPARTRLRPRPHLTSARPISSGPLPLAEGSITFTIMPTGSVRFRRPATTCVSAAPPCAIWIAWPTLGDGTDVLSCP